MGREAGYILDKSRVYHTHTYTVGNFGLWEEAGVGTCKLHTERPRLNSSIHLLTLI